MTERKNLPKSFTLTILKLSTFLYLLAPIYLIPHSNLPTITFLYLKNMDFFCCCSFIVTFNVAKCQRKKLVPVFTYILAAL